jgi:hypothetical protein
LKTAPEAGLEIETVSDEAVLTRAPSAIVKAEVSNRVSSKRETDFESLMPKGLDLYWE